jgi:DNA-directed RNA polymerase subunit RPC12/RpoP
MDKKKMIMIAVVVACLGLAAAITFNRTSERSGTASIDSSQKVWVRCNNPSCGAEYQMPAKEYFEGITKARTSPTEIPPLVCEKCKQESLYQAEKCPKCGKLFFYSRKKGGDYPDRCPHCSYSPMEEARNKVKSNAPASK